ncbi:MAG: F0F1 ATP synthase subunit epsilon [Pseudomonadota bacterium]
MAETFQFELVSPARLVISEAVEEVVVPGAEGDFGVLAGHAPFMSTMRPGFIEVKREGGTERIFVPGGFADTTAAGLTILAEEAIAFDDLKPDVLDAAIAEAEKTLEGLKDENALSAAQMRIAQLRDIRAGL